MPRHSVQVRALPGRVYRANEEPERHSRAMTSLSRAREMELCRNTRRRHQTETTMWCHLAYVLLISLVIGTIFFDESEACRRRGRRGSSGGGGSGGGSTDREDGGLVGRTVDCRSRGRWSSGKNSRLQIERTVV
ncbi:hypothetical protein LSAT2_017615 [Lamellibrachia satsuma]|nr:hypothetical protein LSAT2_017615 [Lamellibrachia satsuma]